MIDIEVLEMPRGSGKTTLLIKESAKTGKPIDKVTYTPKELKEPKSDVYNCSLNDEGKIHFNMNELPLRIDLDGNLEFYVGGDLGWILINNEDKEEESKMSNSYNLNDFGYFSANVYKAMKRCIKDINVIVPNKVVEITFCDNEKEKMVCHEEDTFDLRRCCFIAIAKHLYKEEYTYEGIEYMAEQLMYKKAFVKTVDQALKKYKKKLVDKEKAEKEEAERKEILKRQAEKKRRYKARRAQRYKEEMVDLIADSINEAKERRK